MNFCFARSPARHVKRMRVCAASVHDKHPLPDLLVVKPSYSRPRVSDDNAYAESRFRTAKYRPEFPAKGFGDLYSARRLGQCIRALVQRRTSPQRHSLRHAGTAPCLDAVIARVLHPGRPGARAPSGALGAQHAQLDASGRGDTESGA